MNYLRIIDCSAKKIFFGITIITSGVVCFAAEADRGSLKHLKEEIDIRGHAPVLIHLIDSSLDEIKSSKIALSNRVQQAEEKLLAELDGEYVRDWKWKNDLGQIELYLSGNGIDILSQSINAISFDIGGGWKKTTKLQSWDDSYDVIYSKITKNSLAKGLVVPHVSNLSIEPMKDGRISLTAPALDIVKGNIEFLDFIKRLDKSKIRDQIGKIENQINLKPEKITDIAIDLDLPSFLALVNSQFIRGILPVDANSRKAQVSNKILESAKTNGSTNFIITIREPLPAKNTTPNEQRTRFETNKKIITDILKQSGDIRLLQEFPDFNSFLVEATYDQLNRLSISQDSRVSAILENTVIASTGLITSVPTINAPPVWSYGYTGAGQGLIIIDTGVDLNHPWLSGNVVSLACFGTTGPDTYGALYTSYCPGASASTNWDSPSTESNPAGPLGGPSGVDSHGTHVAGIAASHDGMFRGVAPGATIYSVVAASRGNSNNAPVFLASDLLAAYQAIVLAAPYTPGYNQPYTINLSIWSNATIYSTPCTSSVVPEYQATLIAYQKMKDAGIPIVTITGNAGWKAGIAWPACAPNTIKVSSTKNDVIGNTLSSFANVVNPLNYPLEALWLAPGGGDGTSITSAVPGAAGGQKMGTSMAAPHVAGAYALAKNVDPTVTVDGWNSWFKFNASVPVNVQVSSFEQGPQTTVQWRRLRFPY